MSAAKRLSPKTFSKIKALVLDVDGVLTDGSIIYDSLGGETKVFSVRDGLGLRLLMDAGIAVAILTGRSSPALRARCENLGIKNVWDGISDKADHLDEIAARLGVKVSEIAYVGDDLPDVPVMVKVGAGVAVSDAHPAVIGAACAVTAAPGGRGAVREVCEAILAGRGLLDQILKTRFGIR